MQIAIGICFKGGNQMTGNESLKVSIILPCRGIEENLEINIKSIVDQNYKNLEVILVTTEHDKSLSILEKFNREFPELTKVCVAKNAKTCSQKMQNQFDALRFVSSQADYILFLDSDGKLDKNFVHNMILKFDKADIGLVTGWRWYIPENKNPFTFIRSAWNAAVFPFLISNKHNIAFGGAMMIKKDLFYSIGANKVWLKILSDGLTLASLVKKNGKKVVFAPNCIVASSEKDSFSTLLEWTNRQTTISRVYMKEFWRMTSLGYLSQIFLMIFCFFVSILNQNYWLASICIGGYLTSMLINGYLLLKGVMKLLPEDIANHIKGSFFKYLLWSPFANFLYGCNIARSVLSNKIEWRGIKYKIISNTNTLILKS